jgi:hypothetical protein
MKPRNAPAFATWLLNLFCSGPEHDSVVGDLTEKYQQHGGRFRYWRETFDILLHAIYCKVARRPLTSTHRTPVGSIFAVLVIFIGLAMVLLTGIAPILLIPAAIGASVALLRFLRHDEPSVALTWDAGRKHTAQGNPARPIASFSAPDVARINISTISIGGGMGAGILILMLLTAVLHDVPPLRILAVPGMVAGLVVAALLRFWRKRHPRDIEKEWISIRPK